MSHKLIFEKFEKDNAYFKTEDNKTIILPANFLDKDTEKGSSVYLEISKEDSLAKDILNELLDTEK
ncbi:MAG: hypothetical protein PF572_00095 [Patescibacteria group bacterium]|jgi:hypothetical protein|nr:hypothetical protein [Patescibacteria group bacterium]